MERPGKRQLLKRILILIAFIFVANLLSSIFYWYSAYWWLDMPMHFLGGVFVSLSTLFLVLYTNLGKRLRKNKGSLITYSILSVITIGAFWELFELSLDSITLANMIKPMDSWSDLFFDVAGSFAGVFYFLDRKYDESNA